MSPPRLIPTRKHVWTPRSLSTLVTAAHDITLPRPTIRRLTRRPTTNASRPGSFASQPTTSDSHALPCLSRHRSYRALRPRPLPTSARLRAPPWTPHAQLHRRTSLPTDPAAHHPMIQPTTSPAHPMAGNGCRHSSTPVARYTFSHTPAFTRIAFRLTYRFARQTTPRSPYISPAPQPCIPWMPSSAHAPCCSHAPTTRPHSHHSYPSMRCCAKNVPSCSGHAAPTLSCPMADACCADDKATRTSWTSLSPGSPPISHARNIRSTHRPTRIMRTPSPALNTPTPSWSARSKSPTPGLQNLRHRHTHAPTMMPPTRITIFMPPHAHLHATICPSMQTSPTARPLDAT